MTLDLDRLEALARRATPGPWEAEPDEDPGIEGPNGGTIAFVNCHKSMRTIQATGEEWNKADCAFIAAVDPTTVLEMVAEMRRLQAKVQEMQDFHHLDICLDSKCGKCAAFKAKRAARFDKPTTIKLSECICGEWRGDPEWSCPGCRAEDGVDGQ